MMQYAVIPGWCTSTKPGISRFRVRYFVSPRNDCLGRHDRALNLTKANAISIALAPAAHRYRIAVFQKRPCDSACQLRGLRAVPGNLKQTAALTLFGSGNRAGAREIADIHGAAG